MELILGTLIGLLQSIGWGAADYRFQWTRRFFLFLKNKQEKTKEFNKSYKSFSEQFDSIIEDCTSIKSGLQIISKSELKEIIELDIEGFGEIKKEYGERESLFELWYDISPESFVLIRKNETSIGFCIVFPSNSDTYRKYVNGKISLYQFDESNINTVQRKSDTRYIYIHSVYIKPEYRNDKKSIIKIISALYTITGRFIKKEKPTDNVLFTEAISQSGQQLVKKFGFFRYENDYSFDGNPIFHLDFAMLNRFDHSFRKRARNHLGHLIELKKST